jgi:hypothetical protein
VEARYRQHQHQDQCQQKAESGRSLHHVRNPRTWMR